MQQNIRTGQSRILALLYSQRKQSQQSLEKKQLVTKQTDSLQQFGSQLLEKARVQVYRKYTTKEQSAVEYDSQMKLVDFKQKEVRIKLKDTLSQQNKKPKDLSFKRQNRTCSTQKRVHLNQSQPNLNKSEINYLNKLRDTNIRDSRERYNTQTTTIKPIPQQSKILINFFDDTSYTFGRNISEPKICNRREIFPNKVCIVRKQMSKKNQEFQSITLL